MSQVLTRTGEVQQSLDVVVAAELALRGLQGSASEGVSGCMVTRVGLCGRKPIVDDSYEDFPPNFLLLWILHIPSWCWVGLHCAITNEIRSQNRF